MKTKHWVAFSATVSAICLLASDSGAQTSAIPLTPVGVLSAFPTAVQTGTKPTLTWAMVHPSVITGSPSNGNGNCSGNGVMSSVRVGPPGTLIPNQNLWMTVQIVGTGGLPVQGSPPLPTEARVSVGGLPYKQLFYGTQANVNPSQKLYIKQVSANQQINFGGRFVRNGVWSPFYTTRSSNLQAVTLVNGNRPITYYSLYQASRLASYLRPYLDSVGNVKIGPLSALIVMELDQTDHAMPSYDYQDMVLLVTFSTTRPSSNNGHGNNLDGVDSSNPGNGSGGPNGGVDPSGGVDDEG